MQDVLAGQCMRGGEKVRKYMIAIEVPKGKVKEILDKLDAAQQTIYDCYHELEELGIVTIKEQAVSEQLTTC